MNPASKVSSIAAFYPPGSYIFCVFYHPSFLFLVFRITLKLMKQFFLIFYAARAWRMEERIRFWERTRLYLKNQNFQKSHLKFNFNAMAFWLKLFEQYSVFVFCVYTQHNLSMYCRTQSTV